MVVIYLALTEQAFSIDDFQNPKVFLNGQAVCTLLVRLIMLEPGTIQSHPDMGVGIVSRYRYSVEGTESELQADIQRQVNKYLPGLQGVRITVKQQDHAFYIAAEYEGVLYGVSINTETSEIRTNSASLADL